MRKLKSVIRCGSLLKTFWAYNYSWVSSSFFCLSKISEILMIFVYFWFWFFPFFLTTYTRYDVETWKDLLKVFYELCLCMLKLFPSLTFRVCFYIVHLLSRSTRTNSSQKKPLQLYPQKQQCERKRRIWKCLKIVFLRFPHKKARCELFLVIASERHEKSLYSTLSPQLIPLLSRFHIVHGFVKEYDDL